MKSAVRIWRDRKQRYKYLGVRGKVVSFTKIIHGPEGFSKSPYWVVLVELESKAKTRVEAQLVGRQAPKIGVKVVGVMRRLGVADKQGVIEYGVKFRLVDLGSTT